MSIGILYERSGTDEAGIKLTAEEMGIDLVFLPFRKVAVRLDENGFRMRSRKINHSKVINNVKVVLNRAQSKNRRIVAAEVFETLGKNVINASVVEYICYSKLRTILHFWKRRIKTPETIFIPCDPHEPLAGGRKIHNEAEMTDLAEQELCGTGIVVKPDAGTHGKNVRLANAREDLLAILERSEPSIINPIGILAQRYVQKWFYDLRIIVAKERGKKPSCFPNALARAGFKDFRTNTFLGNMVFGVDIPASIRNVAVECGKAVSGGSEAWVIALDGMIDFGKNIQDDEYVKAEFEKLGPSFAAVKRVKEALGKRRYFKNWNRDLENAFQNYRDQEAYSNVKEVIERSMSKSQRNIVFHEANACPEFWEQTRLIAGINLAVPLLKCAQSMIESSQTRPKE
jgi:glutathione synthase/RimK-type ligase-like ATP-grasp enzyme